MIRRQVSPLVVVLVTSFGCLVARGTTFTVDLLATSPTTVAPGGSVGYAMIGVLSGEPSMGLALWGIDLHSSYSLAGGLPQCEPGPEMWTFVRPYGLTNPAGYGGTPDGDDWLRQIGGGQNTIGNPGPLPPYPIGPVILDIGSAPVLLAFGVAHLPDVEGVYQLEISTLFASVIDHQISPGPPPVYAVRPADPVIGTGVLNITVVPEPGSGLVVLVGIIAGWRRTRREPG